MTGRLVPATAVLSRRAIRRRRLLTAVAVAVALVTVAVGARIIASSVLTWRGIDDLNHGDHAAAEQSFRMNLVANWLDPWRSHFNLGVALYSQGKWSQAQEQFATALKRAPEDKTCVVALNLAWSYEAEGDQLLALERFAEATEAWRQAEAIALDAGCDYQSKGEDRPEDPEPGPEEDPREGDGDGQADDPSTGGEGEDEGEGSGDGDEDGEDGDDGPEGHGDQGDAADGDDGQAEGGDEGGGSQAGGRTEGSLGDQQARTVQRARNKTRNAATAAAASQAGRGEIGDEPRSVESRLEELQEGNQQSQENRQRTSGDRGSDSSQDPGSEKGAPSW